MKPQVLIFIYLGGPMLHFVKCFSSGNFEEATCKTMEVIHDGTKPQDTDPPFKVHPNSVTVVALNVGKPQEVTLTADSPESFKGFLLEARKPGSTTPQGTFSLTDPKISKLQQCGGINDSAVTQTNNKKKTEIKVIWTVSELGVYYFRATFVKNISLYWNAKQITLSTPAPSSTPDPETTITVTTLSNSTIPISTTLSSVATAATGPQQTHLFESSLTLLLLSYLSLSVCGPFLMKVHVCTWMKVTSFLSLAFSFAAFILLLIDIRQVEGKILTGVAASLNLCQTTLIFFLCGPSNELRKTFCWILKVVAFANICFTIAAIYVGLVEHCPKRPCFWPSILMGIYLAYHVLSYPILLYGELKQNNQQQTAPCKQNFKVSCWCTYFVIFSGMNIAFTIALVLGIFLCNCND